VQIVAVLTFLLGGKVSADFLERVRARRGSDCRRSAFAASRGESMTSVTIAALTEHMGTALDHIRFTPLPERQRQTKRYLDT
jgi:hypothetical protein